MQRQIGESTLLWRWTKDKGHIRILNQKGMYNRCHLGRLVLEESVQQEKVDDTGQEIEGKGNDKQEDESKSKVSLNENDSKSKASKTNSNKSNSNLNVKTNKQKNNNTADIARYFQKK